ncbi:Alpha/Beta hydrolase protein [Halenospora varia]|nr:Alpha/Beta hydrolase protein [Halenospora varia]
MTSSKPNKSFIVPSTSHTYSYHYYPSSQGKPTLLFLHGFPSTSHEWRNQIFYFSQKGYGILAPDLLGYGQSSKPLDVSHYHGDSMAADIIAILDHLSLTDSNVVGIGHDWGTYLLSQLACRYQDRFKQFVFMNVPYRPPGRGRDINDINKLTKEKMGYEQFGYWLFFTSQEAGTLIGREWERFFELVYSDDAGAWKEDFAALGGCKSYLESSKKLPVGDWVGNVLEEKAVHHEAFGDDYSAPLNWYKRAIGNLGQDEEIAQLKRGELKEKIGKETLMITGTKDVVCLAGQAKASMPSMVEKGKLVIEDLDAGHWTMLERADECNEVLERFFEGGVGGGTSKI